MWNPPRKGAGQVDVNHTNQARRQFHCTVGFVTTPAKRSALVTLSRMMNKNGRSKVIWNGLCTPMTPPYTPCTMVPASARIPFSSTVISVFWTTPLNSPPDLLGAFANSVSGSLKILFLSFGSHECISSPRRAQVSRRSYPKIVVACDVWHRQGRVPVFQEYFRLRSTFTHSAEGKSKVIRHSVDEIL